MWIRLRIIYYLLWRPSIPIPTYRNLPFQPPFQSLINPFISGPLLVLLLIPMVSEKFLALIFWSDKKIRTKSSDLPRGTELPFFVYHP
jgi:hypothetical protein